MIFALRASDMFLLKQKRFKITKTLSCKRVFVILSPSHACGLFLVYNNVLEERNSLTELEKSLGIVNAEAGMHLKCNSHTVSAADR